LNKFTGQIKNIAKREVCGVLMLEACLKQFDFLINKSPFPDAVPNAPKAGVRATGYPPYLEYGAFIPTNDVNFVLRNPATFSISVQSCLNDKAVSKSIESIRRHLFIFMRNLHAISSGIRKSCPRNDIFFLSDVTRKSLFGVSNFLNSLHEIEEFQNLETLKEAKAWMAESSLS